MSDTDTDAGRRSGIELALSDPNRDPAVRRAILSATPDANLEHPFQPDELGSHYCAVCGGRPNAKVHRPYTLDAKTARARTQAAYRRVLAKYRADDEATYQARMREAYA